MSDKHLRRAKEFPGLKEHPQHNPPTDIQPPQEVKPVRQAKPPEPSTDIRLPQQEILPALPVQPVAPEYQQPYYPPQPYPGQPQYYPPQPYQAAPQVPQQVSVNVNMGRRKSVVVALLLTFLFGPFGMFYSTIVGGLVMVPVSIVGIFLTFGLSIFITHPICMIWAAVAASD